jgi:hypothetical protein
MLSSKPRIAWLRAEVDTPSRMAAFVKLRSSATATSAPSTSRLSELIAVPQPADHLTPGRAHS